MRLAIVLEYRAEGFEPLTLGSIDVGKGATDGLRTRLVDLWDEFKHGEPNSYSEFVAFLQKRGITVQEDEQITLLS